MATPQKDADDRVTARLGLALKEKLTKESERTGQRDSEIVRAAISEFFRNHKTPSAVNAAILEDRRLRRAA